MKYYLIRNSDGDVYVTAYTKKEIQEELDSGELNSRFLDSLPDSDTNYWGENTVLLIKGEIVVPEPKEVTIKHELP